MQTHSGPRVGIDVSDDLREIGSKSAGSVGHRSIVDLDTTPDLPISGNVSPSSLGHDPVGTDLGEAEPFRRPQSCVEQRGARTSVRL